MEILVVIAVMAVVVGLLFPVLGNTKRSALVSVDISNLRQIGQASELYAADNGGYAYETRSLVTVGYLSKDICRSPLDYTQSGHANAGRKIDSITMPLVTAYKDSYLALGEHVGAEQIPFIEASQGAGWAVALGAATIRTKGAEGYLAFEGHYYRLFFDGSVHRRLFMWKAEENGNDYTNATWLFTDETDRFTIEDT